MVGHLQIPYASDGNPSFAASGERRLFSVAGLIEPFPADRSRKYLFPYMDADSRALHGKRCFQQGHTDTFIQSDRMISGGHYARSPLLPARRFPSFQSFDRHRAPRQTLTLFPPPPHTPHNTTPQFPFTPPLYPLLSGIFQSACQLFFPFIKIFLKNFTKRPAKRLKNFSISTIL